MAYLVDVELLVTKLLDLHLPGVENAPEADVDLITTLPMVIFAAGRGRPTANGDVRLAQVWPVAFTVLDTQRDGKSAIANAKDTADRLTEALLEQFPRSRVADVGVVVGVEPDALFARTSSSVLDGKHITQMDGQFDLTVRPPRT